MTRLAVMTHVGPTTAEGIMLMGLGVTTVMATASLGTQLCGKKTAPCKGTTCRNDLR